MPEPFPRAFKIIVIDIDLPRHNLHDIVVHCRTREELQTIFNENESSILIIACRNEGLIEMTPLFQTISNINRIYILTQQNEILWPAELELSRSTFEWEVVTNENQLMRHLLTTAVYFYVQQGDQHQFIGDHGLANLCFRDAINALNQTSPVD